MRTPTIYNLSLVAALYQVVLLNTVILILTLNGVSHPAWKTMGAWLLILFIVRYTIRWNYGRGVIFSRRQQFTEAIECFEKSYAFFNRYPRLDKLRWFLLFSLSKISYREMSLLNIAFCYGQSGNGQKAIEYYERTLVEFPKSANATAALRLLRSVSEKKP